MRSAFHRAARGTLFLVLVFVLQAVAPELRAGDTRTAETNRASSTTSADMTPIFIGLDAALSGSAGLSGQSIRRGLLIAIQEINGAGGILGRPVELIERDNHGVPDRGIDNIYELAALPDLVAVVGGIHTPVALAELPAIHETGVLYLDPWAAGTAIVDNGYDPSFVFRVSVRDEYAGAFLVRSALSRGFERPGLLLWRSSWGKSNEKAMLAAMAEMNIEAAGVEWFNTSERDLSAQLDRLYLAGADVVMLVANPGDGLTAVRAMAARAEMHRVPMISHWGITGGDFFALGRDAIEAVDLTFLQTFSFFEPTSLDRADAVQEAYCARFGPCRTTADIFAPVGTAHAYDLVHLLKAAIEKAGSIDRSQVRTAMENLGRYEGLVRVYDPPFTATRHDALDAEDFRMCRYAADGAIIPVPAKPAR